jgi:peptidase C25-like protein
MKKIMTIVIASLFIANAFIAFSAISEKVYVEKQEQISLNLAPIQINQLGSYVSLTTDSATSYLMEPGEPTLPVVTQTFTLPIDAKHIQVEVLYKQGDVTYIDGLIQPAPKPVVDGSDETGIMQPSKDVYSSEQSYPMNSYKYDIKIGLSDKKPAMFVNVHCYPVMYTPLDNELTISNAIQVTLGYEQPRSEPTVADEYDLLIITPSDFTTNLQSLVQHKNDVGISTLMVTLDEIYSGNTIGQDDQETIKLYIKEAKETWGVTYVLLVGGHVGQSHNWYLPVRYGHSPDETYLSDLYYADLYKYEDNETVFEDWDSNGNGNIGEWSNFVGRKDIIDGAPDVYVGRLACRDANEVDIIVDKIITYEASLRDPSWFNKMLLIGGDTYPESPIAFEAEIDTELSSTFMDGFTFEKLWASLGTLTGREDVSQAFSQGCGFIHMAGHANPASLVTFPPYDKNKEQKIVIMAMYDIYSFPNIHPTLTNGEKQPIVLIGGCHNSQYNVTLANIITGIQEYGFKGYFFGPPYKYAYMDWVPKCFSWWLTIKPDGGAIATFGNTGLGMGIWDYGYLEGLDGWLFPRFFMHYGQEGKENIGWAQGAAITDYVNEFDINEDGPDRQMVQQWALLGDPSLLPGGYN